MKWIIVLIALSGEHVDQGEFAHQLYDTKSACEEARQDLDFIASKINPDVPKLLRSECRSVSSDA